MNGWELVLLAIIAALAWGEAVLAYSMARSPRGMFQVLGLVPALIPLWPIGVVAYACGWYRRKHPME